MRKVQVFRMLSSKAELYALGDLAEPVTQYDPIGSEFFPSVESAVDYARARGWQVLRVET
jgi:hypothetical protein